MGSCGSTKGIVCRLWRRVMRVRPIGDRHADRAAWVCKNLCGREGYAIAAGMIGLAEASMVRGHAGQSFRLTLAAHYKRKFDVGINTQGQRGQARLRGRHADKAASVCKNLCGFEEVKYDVNVRFFCPMGPRRRTWNAACRGDLYVNRAVFFR